MISRLLPLLGTASLIAVVAMLGAKALEVSRVELQQPATLETTQNSVPISDSAQIVTRPAIYYAAITDRPLFEPDRRPYVAEPQTPPPEPEPLAVPIIEEPEPVVQVEAPPPTLSLQGIMTRDNKNAALIGIDGADPEWMAQGEPISTWVLSEIGNDWIEISRDARRIRVDMY